MTHSNPGGRRGAPAVRPDLPDPDAPQLRRGRGETPQTRGSQRTAESTLSSPAVKRVTRPKSIRQGDRAAERRPRPRHCGSAPPRSRAPPRLRPATQPQPRPPPPPRRRPCGGLCACERARLALGNWRSSPKTTSFRTGRQAPPATLSPRRDAAGSRPRACDATSLSRPLSRDVRDVSVSCSEASEPSGAEAASVRPPRGTGVFLGGVSVRGPADDLFPFLRF